MTKPVPSALSQEDGWIDPDGAFYACGYTYHATLAEQMNYSVHHLEQAGWLHISSGVVVNDDPRLTQAQIDTLFDLTQLAPDTSYGQDLLGFLERFLTEE